MSYDPKERPARTVPTTYLEGRVRNQSREENKIRETNRTGLLSTTGKLRVSLNNRTTLVENKTN